MDFSGFDFNAIRNLVNSLSDEEAAAIGKMAGDMMSSMQKPQEEEETQNWTDYLQTEEGFEEAFSGDVLDALEAAADMEQFYEDTENADYSAAVLFYAKATLLILRERFAPLFAENLNKAPFKHPEQTSLFNYIQELSYASDIQELSAQTGITVSTLHLLGRKLMEVFVLLQRAEYDRVSREELQVLKDLLIRRKLLRSLSEWNPQEFLDATREAAEKN